MARTRILGMPAIGEGAPADLVAFDRNPLEDSSALANPRLIVLDGTVIQVHSGAARERRCAEAGN